jgi:hypothetical protein
MAARTLATATSAPVAGVAAAAAAAAAAKGRGFGSYFQVVMPGTVGTAPGLLVFFDDRRYLFNCGETTQRFASEHRVCAFVPLCVRVCVCLCVGVGVCLCVCVWEGWRSLTQGRDWRWVQLRLARVDAVFLSQTSWACMGGLPGSRRAPGWVVVYT